MNGIQFRRSLVACALMVVGGAFSGCSQKVIDHVAYQISPDLKNISVALVFANNIQSNLTGTFPIKTYGDIFVQPYSATQPFELGFSLDTAVAGDNGYVHLTPTSSLPNGVPLGVDHPLVEISGANPISSQFDLAGYVDVSQQEWFGAAATFGVIDSTSFPVGTALTATFDQNAAGNPGILAYVFGPQVDANGHQTKPGGLAVLANIKQLAGSSSAHPGGIVELPPDKEVKLSGAQADQLRGNIPELMKLQDKLIDRLNSY